VSEIRNQQYDQCDECLDNEGPYAIINEGYESGATICVSCAKRIVDDLEHAVKHSTHPKEPDPFEETA